MPEVVDVCYVVDCTGSMSSYIRATKDCIIGVTDRMEREAAVKVRVGFCGYRDHCDGDARLQIFNFTDSCAEFKDYIEKNVSATGGGDAPEDVLGGLNAAVTQMDWRNTYRVLLHICDAPPHGRRFTTLSDTYPDGDPKGLTAEDVLKRMKESKNILYFFGKITNETQTMIKVFTDIIGEFHVHALEGSIEELVEKLTEFTCEAIKTAISLNE